MTLSQLTGLPVSILDNNERVDLASIRRYFSQRASSARTRRSRAIVDRIAMLKAGLNDPGKPIGVFLFAGPTGTGKTELAKTAGRISVRLGRPHDPPRHERVPDARDRRTRSSAAEATDDADSLDQPRAQAAVLRGPARRVREGARQRLGPVPAGVRRRPADRRHWATSPISATASSSSPPTSAPPAIAAPGSASRPRRTPSPATRSCARSARRSGPSSRTGSTR